MKGGSRGDAWPQACHLDACKNASTRTSEKPAHNTKPNQQPSRCTPGEVHPGRCIG